MRALEEDDPRVSEKAEAFIEALNRQEAEAIRKETAVGDNVEITEAEVGDNVEKRWPCQDCGKTFKDRSARYHHRVSKHGHKPASKAKCPICGSKDRNQSRHLERHHKRQEGYAAALEEIKRRRKNNMAPLKHARTNGEE